MFIKQSIHIRYNHLLFFLRMTKFILLEHHFLCTQKSKHNTECAPFYIFIIKFSYPAWEYERFKKDLYFYNLDKHLEELVNFIEVP